MFLNRIVNCKKDEISHRKSKYLQREYKEMVRDLPPTKNFKAAISRKNHIRLISEIKRASPSQGDLRKDLDPLEIARIYEESGASAISVLTEQFFFKGSLEDLKQVSRQVALPVLQKDFFIDVFQIYEARAAGADAILLISALLDKSELSDYLSLAREMGMASIIEVHSEVELENALYAAPGIIGINNRDLKTFKTNLQTTLDLAVMLPENVIKISESGLKSAGDIKRLSTVGIDAVLVGECLMRSNSISEKIMELTSY